MTRLLAVLICSFVLHTSLIAGEGMWLPWLLSSMQEGQMKEMGMKMSRQDIYDVNNGSLKDAIVSFGGFCTAEVISSQGLILTNHHCGYEQIQTHSSIENNYLDNGFWASTKEDELQNPGLTATFIVRVNDVTKAVLEGVHDQMSPEKRQSVIDKNMNAVNEAAEKEEHQSVFTRSFYFDQKFYQFITVTYNDVRLVGAPPSSIGKFGSDTDNWVWPRHTGDFALFRIYADSNNMPAEYSEANIPYQPKHHLPISTDGVDEGDFTMVFGFPGRTTEYLPSGAVAQTMNVLNPARIKIRENALEIVDKYMRNDEETRIQYASKYARIANYWKKWIGESLGLKAVGALNKKLELEKHYRNNIQLNEDWILEFDGILNDLNTMYSDIEDLALAREYYSEVFSRNIELMRIAGYTNRLISMHEEGGDAAYESYKARLAAYLPDFYKNYRPEIDKEVFARLVEMYVNNMPISEPVKPIIDHMGSSANKDFEGFADELYSNTNVTSIEKINMIFEMETADALEALKKDPLLAFASDLKTAYDEHVSVPYNRMKSYIDELQRKYNYSLMITVPNHNYYPDANSTLRLTYGQVEGYSSFDGSKYQPNTYLSGLMEKYVPGDYEFDVPGKLRELYKKKDYGKYKDHKGRMPVCFIGSNHTTGGNSGSPAIDAYGNLIGLNFDRVWEGTMSDIYYDKTYCRNIMVDARYILFIIDKFANAGHLVDEMTLVQPKRDPGSMYKDNPEEGRKIENFKKATIRANENAPQNKRTMNEIED